MSASPSLRARQLAVSLLLALLLAAAGLLAMVFGSSGLDLATTLTALWAPEQAEPTARAIVWQIRLPRILLAAVVGATLSLGGLVFQALLRNPLAEPYILGISGGSAVGAIGGMLLGLTMFPGVTVAAFLGSMVTLALVLLLPASRAATGKDSLLLGGVMVNAFCSAVITFLISLSQESTQVHHILFWLMGDFSMLKSEQLPILLLILPCLALIFVMARPMNLLLLGRESASALGVNVQRVRVLLLVATSFMVSLVVCQSGLVGFVGLVIPHIFRQLLGSDHRLLAPACVLGGGAYLVFCDLLARMLSKTGEMPVGIVTALIGAPLFIFLLWRARR